MHQTLLTAAANAIV